MVRINFLYDSSIFVRKNLNLVGLKCGYNRNKRMSLNKIGIKLLTNDVGCGFVNAT